MNESKIQQRLRGRGKNIRLGLLLILLLIVLPIILLLNSSTVQRSLWRNFVDPRLANIGLMSDFQGFKYNFPNSMTDVLSIDSLRCYLGAENLHSFNSYRKGWDPEIIGGGAYYPILTTYTFGINLKF